MYISLYEQSQPILKDLTGLKDLKDLKGLKGLKVKSVFIKVCNLVPNATDLRSWINIA